MLTQMSGKTAMMVVLGVLSSSSVALTKWGPRREMAAKLQPALP
jgi:hypothetical protein